MMTVNIAVRSGEKTNGQYSCFRELKGRFFLVAQNSSMKESEARFLPVTNSVAG